MNKTWAAFRSDPYYLTKYFSLHTVVLLVLTGILLEFRSLSFDYSFHYTQLFHIPFAIILGIQIPVLMHNCMHGNLKYRTLNVICGELSGMFALMSLGILRINHTLHHAFSDSHNDPHDPAGKSFIKFFFVSQLSGAKIIEERYLSYHGRSIEKRALFKINISLHYGGHFLRLLVWYLILGPELFVSLYLPAFMVYSLAFAHVNYITHRKNENGETEIINKDDNYYYHFINFIGSGVYYHKNHHEHPKLINPMILEGKIL